jgi:colanic acid/amylovoran biosynthesis glycosyltransferase
LRFPEAKTFCRAHRADLYFYTNRDYYLPLRGFLLQHLSKCYAISEDGRDYLEELFGKEGTSNVTVSKLGTFKYAYPRNTVLPEVPVIVSCSTLTLAKRVHLIAAALSKMKDHKIKWLHFGDGVLRAKIEKQVHRFLSHKGGIEYSLMGNYSNTALMKYYSENQVDLFVNVSSSEGIPVSIMEAMSFGIPVIATAAGGTVEIVKHNYNGFLLNVIATPAEVAESVTRFLSLTDEQRNELGKNAFQTWNESYNAEKNYKQFIDSILAL